MLALMSPPPPYIPAYVLRNLLAVYEAASQQQRALSIALARDELSYREFAQARARVLAQRNAAAQPLIDAARTIETNALAQAVEQDAATGRFVGALLGAALEGALDAAGDRYDASNRHRQAVAHGRRGAGW
jgi:hypothetical protein